VLVEHLRQTAKGDEPEPELTLFDSFDGLEGLDLVCCQRDLFEFLGDSGILVA